MFQSMPMSMLDEDVDVDADSDKVTDVVERK